MNFKYKIIIIDPDKTSRTLLEKYLNNTEFIAYSVPSIQAYNNFAYKSQINLIILAAGQISRKAHAFLQSASNAQAYVPVILLFNSSTEIHESISFPNVFGKIHKGMALPQIVPILKKKLLQVKPLSELGPFSRYNIIGRSQKMVELFEIMDKIANSPAATVLIRGESGTGKELIARAVHSKSVKASQPFVEINCAALPENLLESELFGYEKGAFTDARQTKPGLLELAQGGTFFLDEIGDLSLKLQAKLLKVIEEKAFRRLGGIKNIQVTMRIITASNRNFEKAIQEKSFRADLFYRLNVISLLAPPLRDRKDDLLLLGNYFIQQYNEAHNKRIKGITDDALTLLRNYLWPGNVREFKNVLERSVLLENGQWITSKSLHLGAGHILPNKANYIIDEKKYEVHIPENGISISRVEQAFLKKALKMASGNQSKAARLLKLSRETYRYRCRKYDITS